MLACVHPRCSRSVSTGPSYSRPSAAISRGAIVAIALVAAFCAIILAGSLTYLLLRRRRRRRSNEGRRRVERTFRPRMRSIVLPSEGLAHMEERYPWMRDGDMLGQFSRSDLPRGRQAYDPPLQRQPVKQPELVPAAGESNHEVLNVAPRTLEALEALHPRPDLPPIISAHSQRPP